MGGSVISDRRRDSTVVAYVGEHPPFESEGRFRLNCVDRNSIVEDAPDADCIVLEKPGAGLRTLESLRGTSTPVVLYDREADPAVAARATQIGITEYVPEGVGDDRLIDRIAAVSGASAGKDRVDDSKVSHAERDKSPDEGESGDDSDRFRYLFDALPNAVVDVEFVDGEPIIRRTNNAFEKTFGYEESAIVGTSLNDAIVPPERRSEAERLDENALRRGREIAEVERLSADGRRTFLFSYRYDGENRGFGIYTDITDRLEQEQRLRVLNRVLRHNLRNEMTAIIGYAEILAEEGPTAECREYAEWIYEQARDVSKLGEQVRRIQQALDTDRRRLALDPDSLVADIVDRFRSNSPEATIRVSSGDGQRVIADELLEVAIENLLENSLEHNSDAVIVEIEIRIADRRFVDIVVRDDGKSIPKRERAIVSGNREITQLDHSVGLGLWISRWIVSGVDGELLFGDCEAGSEVILRLRRADSRTNWEGSGRPPDGDS